MIYTTYFANLKKIDQSKIIPVSICGKPIPGWTGLEYRKLAPSWSIYKEYKDSLDQERYIRRFKAEILQKLDKDVVLQELSAMTGGQDFALVCYEKPGDFCHRHLVAEWLGLNAEEIEL